jgi:hypothetical protein
LWGNRKKIDHQEDLGVDGRSILKRTLDKWDKGGKIGIMWLRMQFNGGLL